MSRSAVAALMAVLLAGTAVATKRGPPPERPRLHSSQGEAVRDTVWQRALRTRAAHSALHARARMHAGPGALDGRCLLGRRMPMQRVRGRTQQTYSRCPLPLCTTHAS